MADETISEIEKEYDAKYLPLKWDKKKYSFTQEEHSALQTVNLISQAFKRATDSLQNDIIAASISRAKAASLPQGEIIMDLKSKTFSLYNPPAETSESK